MSEDMESIDVEEDLDYELDIDIEMDEDELLQDKGEQEDELVKRLSMTSVSLSEPQPTPLTLSDSSNLHSDTLWRSSISTFDKLLNKTPTRLANELVELKDTTNGDSEQRLLQEEVYPPATKVTTSVQLEQDVLDLNSEEKHELQNRQFQIGLTENDSLVPNDKIGLAEPEPQPVVSLHEKLEAKVSSSFPSVEANQSENYDKSSTSSTSSASKRKNLKKKRAKNRNRKFLTRNGSQNSSAPSSSQNGKIPSLMSINTMGTAQHSAMLPKIEPLMELPMQLPPQVSSTSNPNSRVPFIIQTQSNGIGVSRTVFKNPMYSRNAIANTSFMRKKQRSDTLTCGDLRNVVLNKRRSFTTVDAILKGDEKQELLKSAEMSDEEKKYLMEIEKQKLKREDFLRRKEWNNKDWQFLD